MSPDTTKARGKRTEKAEEKKAYVKSLLTNDHSIPDPTLRQLVTSKFGSGIGPVDLDAVRLDLGWKWDRKGRGRKLIRAEEQAMPKTDQPIPTGVPPEVRTASEIALQVEDEKLEVDLVQQLQRLMRRQGYQSILIPAEGTAHIKLIVVREKIPGQHLGDLPPIH